MAATVDGTRTFSVRANENGAAKEHFRDARGLQLSTIGLGTYLGRPDEETDKQYCAAIVEAVRRGCNVIDTAINYRHQRSERAIGKALSELEKEGVDRSELCIASKAGFIPFEGDAPSDPRRYVEEQFLSKGVMAADDVVSGCHVMAPGYLRDQLEASRRNLGVSTIDIYYLHNPETQLGGVDREEVYRRIEMAFEFLESAAADGHIGHYGTATWTALRAAPGAKESLSLERLVELAEQVGGKDHRFRFVQLPFNLAMTEAFTEPGQSVSGQTRAAIQAAGELGVHVMSSASIGQGRLTQGLPEWLGKLFRGLATDAQRALQFTRSTPGLTTALVGMKSPAHVRENMDVASVPPAPLEAFMKLFEIDERN